MTRYLTPNVRRWIYGITSAVLYLLGTYKVLTGEQVAAWLIVAGAVTNLAAVNVPASTPQGDRT